MPIRTYSRESEIIGHALSWSLKAWLLLVLALLALAVARSAWQVQYGWTWGVVLRRNLTIAGLAAVIAPATAIAALMVLFVVLQTAPRDEGDPVGPWVEAVCGGPPAERGNNIERLLAALQTPRPQGLRAPPRQALLRELTRCLRGRDPAVSAPDRASLERLHRVLSPVSADVYAPQDRELQREAVGTLQWLLLAPDLRAAVRACEDPTCAAAAIRAAEAWCRRQAVACREGPLPQTLEPMTLWIKARWPDWRIDAMPELQRIRKRLEAEASSSDSPPNSG
jgi:hypothetical protein